MSELSSASYLSVLMIFRCFYLEIMNNIIIIKHSCLKLLIKKSEKISLNSVLHLI